MTHPMTSKPQEAFTYRDFWLNSAALSELDQDDIVDQGRWDTAVKTPPTPTFTSPKITHRRKPSLSNGPNHPLLKYSDERDMF